MALRQRIWLARAIAIVADVVQIAFFPATVEGVVSPVSDAIDIAVCLLLTLLVGWHIAFLPSAVVKLLPVADLAPTWTVAVLLATRGKMPQADEPRVKQVKSTPVAPALAGNAGQR